MVHLSLSLEPMKRIKINIYINSALLLLAALQIDQLIKGADIDIKAVLGALLAIAAFVLNFKRPLLSYKVLSLTLFLGSFNIVKFGIINSSASINDVAFFNPIIIILFIVFFRINWFWINEALGVTHLTPEEQNNQHIEKVSMYKKAHSTKSVDELNDILSHKESYTDHAASAIHELIKEKGSKKE